MMNKECRLLWLNSQSQIVFPDEPSLNVYVFNAYKHSHACERTGMCNLQYVGDNSDAPGGEGNTRHSQCGAVV